MRDRRAEIGQNQRVDPRVLQPLQIGRELRHFFVARHRVDRRMDADAVLVRIIELPGSLLATAKNLKIVSKHGVGYDNIDLDYCKSHGVAVTITPNANSLSVAEHAFTLMLTLAKNIIPVSNEYRTVGFAAKNHAPGLEMTGKTLGLIGMGRIGKHVLHMCKDGLDMHVIVYDPYISEVPEGVEKVDDLSELLRRADVVTLHCLLTDETRKLIDRERLALMKPTALLINCARGPIVDEAALIEALESGRLAGAGLDVTDPEPLPETSPLWDAPNMLITPHISGWFHLAATLNNVVDIAAENLRHLQAGETLRCWIEH